jgi:hypothetical protein
MILPRLKVTPVVYEPPFRWLVPSGSRPGEHHLVELNAFGVNGRCSCPDFTCRHEPSLRDDPTTGGVDKTRCKHIKAVRQHFLDGVIREMTKGLKVVALFLCAVAGAEPTPAFLDALAWAETRNRSITGDRGEALGPFQFHLSAWLDADHHRQLSGLPRAPYETGARCPATSRAYAHTLLATYEVRLRDRGLTPTAERLWLSWTMGFNGAKRIGFKASNAPAYKRRGLDRLAQHLGQNPATN